MDGAGHRGPSRLRGLRGGRRVRMATRAANRDRVDGERMKTIRLALLMSVFALGAASAPPPAVASAHAPQQAYMFLLLYTDSAVVRLEVAVADIERALELGWNPKVRTSREQVQANLAAIRSYVEPRFALGTGAERVTPTYRSFDLRAAEPGEFVLLEYAVARPLGAQVPVTLTPFFEFDEATRRNLVVIQHNWRTGTFNNERNVSLL